MATEYVTEDGTRYPSLNALMEFEHVIRVNGNGTITDSLPDTRDYRAPEVTWQNGTHVIEGDGWSLMDGYSGQDRYSGPVMHESEFIGGGMEQDIISTPGLYVAVVVMDLDNATEDETPDAGWAVARKDIPHADYPHEPGRLYDCPACEAQCFCGDNCPTCQKYGETATCRERHTECVYSGEHS